jgi:hypothetical protein
MAGDDRKRPSDVAVDDMEVGPAYAACADLDEEVEGEGLGAGAFDESKQPARALELHAAHSLIA